MDNIIDPDIATYLDYLTDNNLSRLDTLTVEQARSLVKTAEIEKRTEIFEVNNQVISMCEGDIPIRIYRPNAKENLPVVVYCHGGGWVICDLDTHDELLRNIAIGVGCVVVSVDYRLAPEHKFPAALDDAYAALCWVSDNAEALRVDRTRLAVAGDSAGGNLAAACCLRARDEAGPEIMLQSLWYPVTNLSSLSSDSYRHFSEGYLLNRDEMLWFIDHYLSDDRDANLNYASPLISDDLSKLPKAYIMTAGFDVLRDDGHDYYRALNAAGNSVEYREFSSMVHGFLTLFAIIPAARVALDEVVSRLKFSLR